MYISLVDTYNITTSKTHIKLKITQKIKVYIYVKIYQSIPPKHGIDKPKPVTSFLSQLRMARGKKEFR